MARGGRGRSRPKDLTWRPQTVAAQSDRRHSIESAMSTRALVAHTRIFLAICRFAQSSPKIRDSEVYYPNRQLNLEQDEEGSQLRCSGGISNVLCSSPPAALTLVRTSVSSRMRTGWPLKDGDSVPLLFLRKEELEWLSSTTSHTGPEASNGLPKRHGALRDDLRHMAKLSTQSRRRLVSVLQRSGSLVLAVSVVSSPMLEQHAKIARNAARAPTQAMRSSCRRLA